MQTLATWVKRVLKLTGIGVLALVALAVVLSLIGFAINARDEPLTPQAQALLVPPPNPYAPDDNIYFALAGFEAPEAAASLAAGQARIERYNRKVAVASIFDPEAFHEPVTPGQLEFRGRLDFFTGSVWREVALHAAEVQKLIADNAVLCARYGALHRLGGYYDTAQPSVVNPFVFGAVNQTHRLFLADLALRLRGPETQRRAAFTELGADLQLCARAYRPRRSDFEDGGDRRSAGRRPPGRGCRCRPGLVPAHESDGRRRAGTPLSPGGLGHRRCIPQ